MAKKYKKKHGEEVQRLAEKYAKSDKRRKDIRAIDKQRKDYMKKFDMTQDDKDDPMSVSWRTKRGYSTEKIVNGYLNILAKQENIETSIYKDAGSRAYNDLYKKYYSKGQKNIRININKGVFKCLYQIQLLLDIMVYLEMLFCEAKYQFAERLRWKCAESTT